MRLTILSRDAPPHAGGIADHTGLLAGHLARRGHEVSLVTRAGAEPIAGVSVWTHPKFDRMPIRALATAVASTKPDAILWAYNPFSWGRYGLAMRADLVAKHIRALAPDARFVLLGHELVFPAATALLRGRLWRAMQSHALRRLLVHIDEIIVTTPDRIADLDGRDATVIPVGSNLPDASHGAAEIRGALGIPAAATMVAHLGGVGPGRDLRTALEALDHVGDDIHLVLAGETGPVPGRLPSRIHVPGRQSLQTLADTLAAADCYLHLDPVGPTPGRRTTLVAAMQAGLAIVAFDGEQTDPILRESGAIRLVPPGDAAALAAALTSLSNDADERARLGRIARQHYENSFTWSRITEQVEGVLTR